MMKTIGGKLAMLAAVSGLAMCFACAKQEPVSHFVILPRSGQAEIAAADIEKLRVTLDAVGEHYKMTKKQAGQVGIIRYYAPNDDYEIGFYAKREASCLKVYAIPMTPSVTGSKNFLAFRQNLANVLSGAFPGRVSVVK
jgi:hypothetical protein